MEQEEPVIQQELAGRITLYSMAGCLHCHHAKDHLINMGLPFIEVNVVKNPVIHQQIIDLTGRLTVPQIYFNNIHVGGNEDLQKLSQEELDKLIDLVKNEPVPADAPPIPESEIVEEGIRKEESVSKIDEYADLIMDFKESGIIGSNWICLRLYQNTFTGKKLVNWLVDNKKIASRHSEIMQDLIVKLFSEHITSDGKLVDYKSMAANPVFEEYCQHTTQLQHLDVSDLSRKEKLAFFINLYNALVIHGNIKKRPPKNAWQRHKFFNSISYEIGGKVFSLNDIQNGVLRGNRKGPAQIMKPFSNRDPRLKAALEEVEPLIHFALNYGVISCPPIKAYTAQDVDKQLKISAEAFLDCDDGCQVDVSRKEVGLSQIFKRYKIDFGGTDEKLLKWVLEHLQESPKKEALEEILDHGKVKIIYLPFDWSANSKD
ncbi:uncharacterized protein LOC127569679 [Pristis pectinata]|uniref:uncharacterized protein LOC127569679 n=1 Tax=Pristis pectinata TaxID=685728 RepID=UPI00223DE5E6|nr:uncharacterized protein LOC127569679 [Pristis pectinata]